MWQSLSAKTGGFLPPRALRLMATLLVAISGLYVVTLCFSERLPIGKGLMWNLFLAVLPLPFAIVLAWLAGRQRLGIISLPCGLLWLGLYPNAPYLVTDLIHIQDHSFVAGYDVAPNGWAWFSLMHIVTCVLLGSLAGCLSLYLVHSAAKRRWGTLASWVVVAAASVLSGVGIYIGRFMRFNTWDLWERPRYLMQSVGERLSFTTLLFFLLFSALCAGMYLLFYACFATADTVQEK